MGLPCGSRTKRGVQSSKVQDDFYQTSAQTKVWLKAFLGGPFRPSALQNEQNISREGPFFFCAKVRLRETLVIVPSDSTWQCANYLQMVHFGSPQASVACVTGPKNSRSLRASLKGADGRLSRNNFLDDYLSEWRLLCSLCALCQFQNDFTITMGSDLFWLNLLFMMSHVQIINTLLTTVTATLFQTERWEWKTTSQEALITTSGSSWSSVAHKHNAKIYIPLSGKSFRATTVGFAWSKRSILFDGPHGVVLQVKQHKQQETISCNYLWFLQKSAEKTGSSRHWQMQRQTKTQQKSAKNCQQLLISAI